MSDDITLTINGGPAVETAIVHAGDTIGLVITESGNTVNVSISEVGERGPKGDTGPATSLTIGTATSGSVADATLTGAAGSQVLSLVLPKGDTGATGPAGQNGTNGVTPSFAIGTVSTLSAGATATVTATPSNGGAKVTLDFGLPRGADGTGSGSSVSLSDSTPSALGTASAGTSSLASRSDHAHALPTAAALGLATVASTGKYSDLTGTPEAYSLPVASATVLGGVRIGPGLSIYNGVLSATGGGGSGVGANDTIDGGDYVGVIASIAIAQHPADVSISINQGATGSASFTVSASASTGVAVAYQWQRNEGSGWAAIDAATSATLSLAGLAGADNGTLYRCVVSAFGLPTVATNTASLSVAVIVPSAPVITITAQPQSTSLTNAVTSSTSGFPNLFGVTAGVTSGTLNYQWQKRESGATTWANISGATGETLGLESLSYATDNGDSYRCVLSASGAASVTSATATLTITWATAPQITIIDGPSTVNWPQQSNFCTVTFDKIIYGASNSGMSFLWQALSGSSWVSVTSVLSPSNVYGGVAGGSLTLYVISRAVTVRCVVTATNSYGTTTATTASITVNAPVLV